MGKIVRRLLALGLALVSLSAASVVHAGSGTSSDPWRTINIFYNWSNASRINATYQVITANRIQSGRLAFWAYNGVFTASGRPGYYVGFQTQGSLKGNQNGVVVSKSAHFSLFTNKGASSYRIVTGATCSLSADSTNPASGASCAIQYGWGTGTSYRVQTEFAYNVNNAAWCPSSSPNSCTVAIGTIAPNSNPSAKSQIGVWTFRQSLYGETFESNSFLEFFGVCSAPTPNGQFILPTKVGGTSSLLSASSYDRTGTSPPGSCGRVYNSGLATYIYYTPA